MPNDRMRNDKDLDKNMGGQKDQNKYGQKTPSHNQQEDEDFGTGKRTGHRGEPDHMKDDFGTAGSNVGGQNRPNR